MNLNNKIEWLQGGATWNPITGCRHSCPYCYARNQANRFGGYSPLYTEHAVPDYVLEKPCMKKRKDGRIQIAPYPFYFDPTFHRYRLDEPQKIKKSQNIFVCSMADLFGKWIPDSWIEQVFEACEKAPQHRYLFLTKNPDRYFDLAKKGKLPTNHWYGTTLTHETDTYFYSDQHNIFLSIEPIMSDFGRSGSLETVKWVIVGSESGNRKDKVIPKKEWIERIVYECAEFEVPLFLKNSLKDIHPLIQEYPW